MNRVLAIWLPNWPLQRLIRKQPELRGRPVVLKSRGARGECVVACSDEARARGIEVGMPIAEASALGKRIAGWHQQEHDSQADRNALQQLAVWCHRFAPSVGVEDLAERRTPPWPETLLLDATNLAPLYGGEQRLVEVVAAGFSRLELDARLALADNISVAWAVSHYGSSDASHANADAAPDADADADAATLTPAVVSSEATRRTLTRLPIEALRLAAETTQTLHRLGLFTIDDLESLPRDQLCSRFGSMLLTRIDQAHGRTVEAFTAIAPPPEFCVSQDLEHPLSHRETVEQVAHQLIERVAHLLASHNVGALQMTCRFDCQEGSVASVEAGLFQPSCQADHLWELMQMQLERLSLPRPVVGVQLDVVRHGPLERRQQVLFEAESTLENSRELAALVDRLAGRLGRERVVCCRLVYDAQPELAYRDVPLVGKTSWNRSIRRPSKKAVRFFQEIGPTDRPLQLLERPLAIDRASQDDPGLPRDIVYRGCRYEVARYWGPERIETGWWRRQAVSRDYYRIETTAGQRFWLYRCLRTGNWFLQGIFG